MIRAAGVCGLLGAVLTVLGVALWSVPAACVLSGLSLLALSYGLAYTARRVA